ncbi:MAG: ASCH domain-containing protein [Eubacteriales bacterium]|nr:ASCH domain-containing protein [Eubacteriales bacterium]
MQPTKENTLYLPIKQVYFDQIIAGTKKAEYREVKETTYKKYLYCDAEGNPDISEGTPENFSDDIMAYNNGRFPFVPIEYKYLSLAVGYAKERDTAVVEVENVTFEIAKDKDGKECRFFWDEKTGDVTISSDGDLAIWQVVYHLGKVIELKRK